MKRHCTIPVVKAIALICTFVFTYMHKFAFCNDMSHLSRLSSLRENFKTAAGQLSDRLKIFAGQKKNLSVKKKKKKKKLCKLVVFDK